MICPNKNTKEWKDMVEKWGEAKALQMWQFEPTIEVESDKPEIRDSIKKTVAENPDFFRTKYKTYLRDKLGKDNPTLNEMVEAFYSRLSGVRGLLDGDVVVTNEGNYSLFPISNIDYVSAAGIPSSMEKALQALQKKFKIPFRVINEPSLKWKGRYVNEGEAKMVYINIAHATIDTPFHEYYHPFVRMLLMRNPAMFERLLNEARDAGDNRVDEEEVVTNFLAKEAVKRKSSNIFQAFINFLRRILSNKNIDSYSSLKDVLTALDSKLDLSKERTLTEAFDKIDELIEQSAKKMNVDPKDKPNILDKLVQEAKKYTTSDASNFYQDEQGNDVALRLTALIGDKELGEFSTYGKNFKRTQAEHAAVMVWIKLSDKPIDREVDSKTLTGTIKYDGQEITFDELHQAFIVRFDKARLKGKMVHSFMQYAFEEDSERKAAARQQAIDYAKQYGEPFTRIESHKELANIWDNIEQIAFDANIAVNLGETRKYQTKFKDRIAPEVTIVSDKIVDSRGNKIGTTIDGLVEHPNGDLSLVDWKTGFITKDMNTPYFLKYGAKFGLSDSKLTRGYLELAFRALLIKEKFPNARFRDIKIVKINSDGTSQNMRVELSKYLATIGEYYKETNPSLYKELSEKGLFDAEQYAGKTQSFIEVENMISGMAHEDRLVYLKAKLATLHHGKTKEQIERDADIKAETIKYTNAILELEKMPGVDLSEDTGDLPYLGRFKNLSDISNPKVQTFHRALLKAKDNVAKEKKEIFDEHDRLLRELEKDQATRSNKRIDSIIGLAATASLLTFNPWLFIGAYVGSRVIKRFNVKTKDYWAFMWAKGKDGFYLNTADTYTDSDGNVKQMSTAQRNYRDFVKKKMEAEYASFANEIVAEDKQGRSMTRAQVLKIPAFLPKNFMPRVPKNYEEVREEEKWYQNAMGIASAAKFQAKRYLTTFIEQTFDNPNSPIPFSYFHHEGSTVVEEELYSFDAQVAFKSFMTNMIYKKHMDSMYDLSLGVSSTLHEELDESGKARYPDLAKFVDETIFSQVLGNTRAVELRTKKWKYTPSPRVAKFLGISENTPITVSQDRILRLAKSTVTMVTLGFRVVGPIRNAAMIALTTISQSTKGIINRGLSSVVGVPPDSFDSMDPKAATVLIRDYYGSLMTGNLEDSKLWNIAVRMNWLPDEIPGVVPHDHLLSMPINVTTSSHAYVLYQIGEVGGALWQLAGLLKGIKIKNAEGKESSLWDAYDKKGNWTLGARGVVENGDGTLRKLEELDELEIKTLKRVNERLNGSYRSEEKTAIESTVVGEFIFQFKKYFYQFLKVNFGGEYKDLTYGKYVLDNSAPPGVPKYKWMAEALEGRVTVLAKSMWILLTNGLNGWKKLKRYLQDSSVSSVNTAKNSRVRALSEGLNTALWLSLLLVVFHKFYEDDDDEKGGISDDLYKIIVDNSRGLHPKDIFETAEKPIIGAQRLSDIGDAMFRFLFEGLLTGAETQDGSLVGSKTLLRATPFVGSRMQLIDRFSEYEVEEDPLFNFSR